MNKIVYSLVNYCKQEKYSKVEKLLSHKKKSLTWEDYFVLSSLYLKNKNFKNIEKYSRKILDKLTSSRFAYNNFGNNLFNLNKTDKAIKYYKKSLSFKKNELDLKDSIQKFFKQVSKYRKNKNLNSNKIRSEIEELRAKIVLRQIVTIGRPHFAELYNRIEALVIFLNEILNEFYKKKNTHLNLFIQKTLKKIIIQKSNFFLLFKLNADYENPYFNLARCYLKKNQYEKSVNYFYLANKLDKTNKYNNKILEIYYLLNEKKKFFQLLKKVKKQKKVDFSCLAISNFASEQWNLKNPYSFCENPLNYIYKTNILNSKNFNSKNLKMIEKEIKKNRNKLYTPVVKGHKSIGNLFESKTKNINNLKSVIKKNINNYKKNFSNERNLMINKFPDKYKLNAWFISLKKGGEVTSHIHDGWLSGVFYVKRPEDKRNLKGDIELTSRFKNLPLLKKKQNRKSLKIKPGDLLLFPSSLPHRVIPFDMNKERLSIAFDMKPII